MNNNKLIQNICFVLTIISSVILVSAEIFNYELSSFFNNFFFAIFGSASISWLTALITFRSDIRDAKIDILIDSIAIYKKMKNDFSSKIMFHTPPEIIKSTYSEVNLLLERIFIKLEIYKLRSGKELLEQTNLKTIIDLCNELHNANSQLGIIHTVLSNNCNKTREEIGEMQIEYDKILKTASEKISQCYKEIYGKKFAELNSITL